MSSNPFFLFAGEVKAYEKNASNNLNLCIDSALFRVLEFHEVQHMQVQYMRYRKSPKFDNSTKLRPLLNFFLKMQLTDYSGWKSIIFIACYHLRYQTFEIFFQGIQNIFTEFFYYYSNMSNCFVKD